MHRHSLRLILLCIALIFLSHPSARAAGLEIVRVFTGWHDAAYFQRISEYFSGQETTGGIRVLRTQPGNRAGFYWLVRLKNGDAPLAGTKFVLQVITPASADPKTFTFPADIPRGSQVYQLGLTGTDWPEAKAQPAAWRLSVLTSDGKVLLAKESFLWALPPKS